MITSNQTEKARNFWLVIDPAVAPGNWKEFLRETRLKIAISPLHDRDWANKDTGEVCPPHYHVILMYPNTTMVKTIDKRFCQPLKADAPRIVYDMRGAFAYLTHAYDLDKAQYDANDIQYLNGFDPMDIGEMTFTEKVELQKSIFSFIKERNITSFSRLIDSLLAEDNVYLLDYCRKNFGMICRYLDSRQKVTYVQRHSITSNPVSIKTSKFDDSLGCDA